MACYALHIVEQQDQRPYDDPDVKDLIGVMPQFFCTRCDPLLRLKPSEAMRCLGREQPCWKPGGPACTG